jgi:aryl-alcohol dehydrogenase-like predicted oxidoreductase
MRTSTIGRLEVSAIGLGCNNFGRALDAAGSAEVVAAALDAGVNYFDTASNYGSGQSESFLGAALGSKRDGVVVATKFGVPVPGVPGSGGAHPDYIASAVERSLAELATDRIDLYQLHKPDPDVPIAETLGAMNDLIDRGKVIEIGCSNLSAEQLTEATRVAKEAGQRPFVSNQIHLSMVHRDPLSDGLADVAKANGIGLLPFYPLASGLLTGKTTDPADPQGRLQMDRYQHFLTDENFGLVSRLGAFAADRDLTMVQVALGWLLAIDVVPSVTPGATRTSQVVSNAAAADWVPTDADLDELSSILNG